MRVVLFTQPLTIITLPSPIHPHRPFRQGSICKHITVAILALFITANTDRICIHHRPIIFIQAYIPTNAKKSLQGRYFCVQSLSVLGHLPTGSTLDIKIPRLYNGLARAAYFPYTSLTSDTPQPQKSSLPPASNNIEVQRNQVTIYYFNYIFYFKARHEMLL